jgi:hypothetical protein
VSKVRKPQRTEQHTPTRAEMQAEINRILDRLDAEMPEAQKRMDELLRRLRNTHTRAA